MVNNHHHAYLYLVTDAMNPAALAPCVSSLNLEEVLYIFVPNLGIADVRSLTEKAFMRPSVGDKQLIVVASMSVTIEAQQALLKILEEPPLSTVFLFCLPPSIPLLPTLLSRFSLKDDFREEERVNTGEGFQTFLQLTLQDRLAEITKRLTAKDVSWVTDIKNGLLLELKRGELKRSMGTGQTLYFVAEHLQTRGASNKHLLEELAFTLTPAAEK